eukprot:m.128435 g.128435  ORF g.128435 m.128435 type:complete len:151 (-) comp13871_c0_seq1:1142-1594(-)
MASRYADQKNFERELDKHASAMLKGMQAMIESAKVNEYKTGKAIRATKSGEDHGKRAVGQPANGIHQRVHSEAEGLRLELECEKLALAAAGLQSLCDDVERTLLVHDLDHVQTARHRQTQLQEQVDALDKSCGGILSTIEATLDELTAPM